MEVVLDMKWYSRFITVVTTSLFAVWTKNKFTKFLSKRKVLHPFLNISIPSIQFYFTQHKYF